MALAIGYASTAHYNKVPELKKRELDPDLLRTFKDALDGYSPYRAELIDGRQEIPEPTPEKIAAELFKMAPAGLELEDIVDLVFEYCNQSRILLFVDAICQTRPSFTLSPYDKIRLAIVKDEKHLLNNSSLLLMMKEERCDEEKLAGLQKLAYRMHNPYIYAISRIPVLTSSYTLNFLWVNLNPQDRIQDVAQNIFRDGLDPAENAALIKDPAALRNLEKTEQSLSKEELEQWEKIKLSFMYRLSKWADVQPGAQINLWYDSALVTQKAQQNSFEMVQAISRTRKVDIKLRDIRQLSNLHGEIEHSLHPGTQVYFRVDMLKILIGDHMTSSPNERATYCVFSDIDVEPMPQEQMFDQRTVDYLSSSGYVFNRVSLSGSFENSFFIFNREKEDFKRVHRNTMITMTARTITQLREHPEGACPSTLDSQFLFRRYNNFRNLMNDSDFMWDADMLIPRKVVKWPFSQFNFGGHFPKSDFRAEIFRFIGDSNIPYTQNGRNPDLGTEKQIQELLAWNAVLLPSPHD